MVGKRTPATFALVAALSACSQPTTTPTPGGSPELDDSAGSQTVTAPAQSSEAGRILERAVGVMAAEPVVGFKFEMALGGDPVFLVDGFANARGWKATGEFTAPGSASSDVMYARGFGDASWMQMRGWPPSAAGCWLDMNGQAPLGIQALTPPEPSYVGVLAHLHADSFAVSSRDTLAGELDLPVALTLLQAQLFEFIEVTTVQIADAKVPVDIGYKGQRITTVTMSGPDVMTSIEDAGGTVTSMSRTALENSDYTVTYPTQAKGSRLAPPPSNLVMTGETIGCH